MAHKKGRHAAGKEQERLINTLWRSTNPEDALVLADLFLDEGNEEAARCHRLYGTWHRLFLDVIATGNEKYPLQRQPKTGGWHFPVKYGETTVIGHKREVVRDLGDMRFCFTFHVKTIRMKFLRLSTRKDGTVSQHDCFVDDRYNYHYFDLIFSRQHLLGPRYLRNRVRQLVDELLQLGILPNDLQQVENKES